MPDTYVAVLTYKSVPHILKDGGTQSWRADRKRLRNTGWVICARNLHGPYKAEEDDVEHRQAFLIAEIEDVVDADDGDGRQKITFRRYATFEGPIIPFSGKNPVQYFDREDLDIDMHALEWQTLEDEPEPLSAVDQAKALVAEHFGVYPEQVEISVRL